MITAFTILPELELYPRQARLRFWKRTGLRARARNEDVTSDIFSPGDHFDCLCFYRPQGMVTNAICLPHISTADVMLSFHSWCVFTQHFIKCLRVCFSIHVLFACLWTRGADWQHVKLCKKYSIKMFEPMNQTNQLWNRVITVYN